MSCAAGSPLPVVVLVHGFKGFRRWGFWGAISEALLASGLGVVGFDMSHNGVGPGGLEFDEDKSWDENKAIYHLSDKIVRTSNTTQTAVVGPDGNFTTVVAAAVFLF